MIFKDFRVRRFAILHALTHGTRTLVLLPIATPKAWNPNPNRYSRFENVEELYMQCDPEKENMCPYGYSNEAWEVALPAEEVLMELPEPTLGINFAHKGMNHHDWLALVAVH